MYTVRVVDIHKIPVFKHVNLKQTLKQLPIEIPNQSVGQCVGNVITLLNPQLNSYFLVSNDFLKFFPTACIAHLTH